VITIYKQIGKTITRTAMLEKNCWLRVTAPTEIEIETLMRDYGLPADTIKDILDLDERPRYEREDGYRLIILRVPWYEKETEVPYRTLPLGIVLLPDLIVTIGLRETDFLASFVDNRVRGLDLADPVSFVLHLLHQAARGYLRDLKEINRRTGMIEKDLQKSIKNNELIGLLALEKSLVYFTTSLKGNEMLIHKLQRTQLRQPTEEQEDLCEEVITENRQAIEMADIYSNILSGLMDAFASVISNNLNVVMKRLTTISIVLMIPTLFASLYGMNVALPLQGRPLAFWGIAAVSLAGSLLGALVLMTRRAFR
jgi:magnesium transporter